MEIKGRFGSQTDIGLVRKSNEDKALSLIDAQNNILLCVCDGMGGYMKGDFASKIAVDVIGAAFRSHTKWLFDFQVKLWISKVIKSINFSVYYEAQDSEKFSGMGTTLCMAILFKNKIYVANVGDSRCYKLESEKIVPLTKDQTYVEYLLTAGKISEQEKLTSKDRHVLMNFIGQKKEVNYVLDVYKNDASTIMLCSDGLYNNATDKQIFAALDSSERLDQKINTLIGIANANGGSDNIAISIWEPYKHD